MSAHQIKTFLTAEGNGWYCLGHSNIEMKSIALCNLFHYLKARDCRTSSPNFHIALGLTRNTKDLLQYQVRADLLRGMPLSMILELKLGKDLGTFVVLVFCLFDCLFFLFY